VPYIIKVPVYVNKGYGDGGGDGGGGDYGHGREEGGY